MGGSEDVTVWKAFSYAQQGCPAIHAGGTESVEILILMKNVLFYNKDITNAQMVICIILDEEIYLD